MLSRISVLNPDHFYLVKFYEKFQYSCYTCLVFELLGMDLLQYLTTELCSSLFVNQIRPIAKQMLVALQGLQSLQIIHTDIKADNIMLANNEEDTFQVKLIDFGLALPSSSAKNGTRLQPIGYRAPEVCLGLPNTEAIDMWGLGCTLANLYLNSNLFPVNCEYLMLSMLSRISVLNPDHFYLVKFYEKFQYSCYTCLVFELLGMDLLQYLTTELCSSLFVNQIRPIAKQMLVALQGLQSLQIIHTDIKADNIMLANNEEDTFQVKLIDFGLALPSSSAKNGTRLQPIGYRAPEVCLGLPYTEAIDMWGLGCTLANLYLNSNLFPVNCEYLMMKSMVEYLGMPSDHQLRLGMHTKRFFCHEQDELGLRWRLLTPEEYSDINRVAAKEWPGWRPHFYSLDDLFHIFQVEDGEEVKDRRAFIDFLKQLLNLDGGKRLSPTEALQHPFITMSHLSQDPDNDDYLTTAQALMSTKASLSVHYEKDVETHVAEQRFDEVPLTPASSQIRHIETDVPKVPLSDVNDDNGSIQEPSQDWGKDLHRHSTQDDSGIWSLPEQFHSCCDESVESVSSVNRPVVEDVPFHTPKRFRNIGRFFSIIRTTFFDFWSNFLI